MWVGEKVGAVIKAVVDVGKGRGEGEGEEEGGVAE